MISSPIAAEPLVRRPRRRAASFSLLLALAAGSVLAADKPTGPAPATNPPLAVPAPAATETKAATGAAERWLLLVDQGKYAQSWDDAAQVFKRGTTAEKWASGLKSVRDPIGRPLTRKLHSADYSTTLQGAPAGEYVTVAFLTQFELVPPALETLALTKEADGNWRVVGYAITDAPARN